MAISRAQINWTGVAFASTTITRVTQCAFGLGGTLLKLKADTDLFPSLIACADIEPHASVTTFDVGPMMGLTPGASGTLTATLNDAKSISGGAVVFTMSGAVFETADAQAQHAQYGSVTGSWQAYASDGTTPPLVITRV
jgi:hypothetical protein